MLFNEAWVCSSSLKSFLHIRFSYFGRRKNEFFGDV